MDGWVDGWMDALQIVKENLKFLGAVALGMTETPTVKSACGFLVREGFLFGKQRIDLMQLSGGNHCFIIPNI